MNPVTLALVLVAAAGCTTARKDVSPPPLQPDQTTRADIQAKDPADEAAEPVSCETTLAGAQLPSGTSPLQRLDVVLGRVATKSWSEADQHLAVGLCVFADALRERGGDDSPAGTIEKHASLLAGAPKTSVGKCGQLKEGFNATLAGLEAWQAAANDKSDSRAMDVARAAVGRVDPNGLIAFQRAAIQDALRTLTTAYAQLQGGDPTATSGAR